jgi:hypothetical protein
MVDHVGYTCWEVLHGAIPDKKRFAAKMHEARAIRMEENRSFKCIAKIGCEKN